MRLASTTALAALIAALVPATATCAGNPDADEQDALQLAAVIRHDAVQDRRAPETLVRTTRGRGGVERLAVFYGARPGAYASSGGYELLVVTAHGQLTEAGVAAFPQITPYAPGSKPEQPPLMEIQFDRHDVKPRAVWFVGFGGAGRSCGYHPGPKPAFCPGIGGSSAAPRLPSEAARLLHEAEALVAAGRHREPIA